MRLIVLKTKRVSVENLSEWYTTETWRSMSKSSGVLAESQQGVKLRTIRRQLPPKYGAFLVAFSLHRTSPQVNLVDLKVY